MDRYRTIPRRLVASLIDALPFVPVFLVSVYYYRYSNGTAIGWAWGAVVLAVSAAYMIYFHGRYGATPGKSVMKCRVVRSSDEKKIGYGIAALREGPTIVFGVATLFGEHWASSHLMNVASIIRNVSAIWGAADLLTVVMNPKRRALHDFIAGSVVLKDASTFGRSMEEQMETLPSYLVPATGTRRATAGLVNTFIVGALVLLSEFIAGDPVVGGRFSMAERWNFLGLLTVFWLLCILNKKSIGATVCLLEVRRPDGSLPGAMQMLIRSTPFYALAVITVFPCEANPAWVSLIRGLTGSAILLGFPANGFVGISTHASILDRGSRTALVQFNFPDIPKPRLFGIRIF